MQSIKQLVIILLFMVTASMVFAQKQSFDVVNYEAPKGWDKMVTENGVQLSTKDDGKGNYAVFVIVRSVASTASAKENFDNSWQSLVKGTVKVTEAPSMSDMDVEKGWDVLSGQANYTDGANKGLVTLITATGNGKMANVVIMTNTSKYQDEVLAFVNSLELNETVAAQNNSNSSPATNANGANNSVAGLWTDYVLETTGYYINNMPQYTSGYLRKEYNFYPDGTYLFRNKQWLTKAPDISFICETGTYTVQGNQLTLTPKNGKAGFWGKMASTKEWGALKKASGYKPEKTVYNFEIIHDATYGNSIVLRSTAPTQRDGGKFNSANEPYEFRYSFRTLESLVDNPPGWKN